MTLPPVVIGLSAAGAVSTGVLAVGFAVAPRWTMARVSHQLENLPAVMADRYLGFTLLALGAAWYGNMAVIAFLFAVFAVMSLADALIYRRAGKPIASHMTAGVAATTVAGLALLAQLTGAA